MICTFFFPVEESALSHLLQIQLEENNENLVLDDQPDNVLSDELENSGLLGNKRSGYSHVNPYSSGLRRLPPSRMSYDPQDFAYRMSPWNPDTQNTDASNGVRPLGRESSDAVEFLEDPDKRRWRGNGCDFSRVTYRQFVQFLKTGVLCGRRGNRVRFGLSGKR